MKKWIIVPISFFILACFCSCGPWYYLQGYSAKMIADNGRIQIEPGYKKTYGEAGFSYGNFLCNDTLRFVNGKYYNFDSHREDSGVVNTRITNSTKQLNFYGAFLSERHLASSIEIRMAHLENRMFYDIVAGFGVRFYKGSLAGRIYGLFGLSSILSDVFVFEKSSEGDYDHIDYFNKVKKSAGLSLNCNTTFEKTIINPFVSLNARYYTLFGYKSVYIDLLACSMAAGIYSTIGPFIPAIGIRANYYYKNKGIFLHPAISAQITYAFCSLK